MSKLFLQPHFQADMAALQRNHRKNYDKASGVLYQAETGEPVSRRFHPESRIPSCYKYELSDGYRLILQVVEGEEAMVALCVGTHDHVDTFLDTNRGYVFYPRQGRVKQIRLSTVDDTRVRTVPSAPVAPPSEPTKPAFADFDDGMLARINVPKELLPKVKAVLDTESLACMDLLALIGRDNPAAADALLAFATGNSESRESILAIARGEAQRVEVLTAEHIPALEATTDEFVSFDDPSDLQEVLQKGEFERWQLFLHPDQREIVDRSFDGPARIRGISGSGKTVVAFHRARALAKRCLSGPSWVLLTTFNKGLAESAGDLLDTLCGVERARIEATHLHKWCLEFIAFRGIRRPQWSPEDKELAQRSAVDSVAALLADVDLDEDAQFLWDEVEFIMGRFLDEEVESYLTTDRTGRGRPLSSEQRSAVVALYKAYMEALTSRGCVDPAEFVRIAYRLRKEGELPEREYAAVIVDEVQDISEIGLKLLHGLVGDRRDGLLLVGDGTQRIFTRGYSMRGLGIEVGGRSIVLRKNYRNTRQILEAAFPLVRDDWAQDVGPGAAGAAVIEPQFSVREGEAPLIVRCTSAAAEARFVRREVHFLLETCQYQPGDICVMARNPFYRTLALKALTDAGIPVVDYKADDGATRRAEVRVSTLHSAKGHEYAAIFILGLVEGVFPQRNLADVHGLSGERALLYVGMTRARDIVYLSYADTGEGGRPQQRSRFLDAIAPGCEEMPFRE